MAGVGVPDNGEDGTDDDDWETESELDHGEAPRQRQSGVHYASYSPDSSSEWKPFPGKAWCLADVICNSRRVHFGRRHIEIMLEFARQTQGETIPTYYALRKFQKSLKSRVGDPSKRYVSPFGTVYYVNKISEGLKQDMSNPHVRPHMNFFPHVDGKRVSQTWHGHKMIHDIPDHLLTPCIRHNNEIFYVGELVRRAHDWFIPLRWITVGPNHEPYAIGHKVENTPTGLRVFCEDRITIRLATFLESFHSLEARAAVPAFDDVSADFRAKMPHRLRSLAGSRLVYSVPLIIFMDDTSGNVSKQWNKHWSCYLSNAALPREVLQSEYYVRFASTSTHASPLELMQGIRASIEEAFENPVVAYDCVTGEEVLVCPFGLFWAGDNPMQAEECSSSGLNSNHFCRTCDVGGTDEYKQSLDGYKTLFKTGNRRVASNTSRLVNERLDMAILPKTVQKIKHAARDTGVKDALAQPVIDRLLDLGKSLRKPAAKGTPCQAPSEIGGVLQRELQLARDHCVNPLLSMDGVDIHRDTPTEILHTVLLGVVKYYWGQSVFLLDKAKK
ncbi:hypothetical protein FRC06_001747, partial [Ceratobasidium sp. 370]